MQPVRASRWIQDKVYPTERVSGATSSSTSTRRRDRPCGAPPTSGRRRRQPGALRVANKFNFESHDFMQVSIFATMLRTMKIFETDTLGRELESAFSAAAAGWSPAGKSTTILRARVRTASGSFHFPSKPTQNRLTTVYTSLSPTTSSPMRPDDDPRPDRRDLYGSITPQSLALHEAITDLTALVISFREQDREGDRARRRTGWIADSTAFTSSPSVRRHARTRNTDVLPRNLLIDRKLGDRDVDEPTRTT